MNLFSINKKTVLGFAVLIAGLVFVPSISAHVSVKPAEVGVGKFQTFTIGVPNEKENNPTVAVRLIIPEGFKHVSPNVKPGWTINFVRTGEGEEARIAEISWTGGSIPSGQRDDFLFSAQAPSEETTVQWKAYQTYADGTIVAWDLSAEEQPKDAEGKPDFSKSGPFSTTKIINDLKPSATPNAQNMSNRSGYESQVENNTPFVLSGLALLLASISLGLQFRKKF